MKKIYFFLIVFFALNVANAQNWETVSSGTDNYFLSAYFIDANTGYFVGTYSSDGMSSNSEIFKTINAGKDFSNLGGENNQFLYSVYFTNACTGYVVGSAGNIVKTTDCGMNWNPLTSNTTNDLNSVWFTGASTGFIVGSNGTILETSDGGSNWDSLTSNTPNSLNSIYFIDANNGYAVGDIGTILKTTNAGLNWATQTSNTTNNLYSVYFIDANNGYAVGDKGIILKTSNGGMNWVSQTSNTTNTLNSIFFIDANNGYAVGSYGAILKTNNGGSTWTDISPETSYNYYSVTFPNAQTGFIVGSKNEFISEPTMMIMNDYIILKLNLTASPTATTNAATNISTTTATLNGSVNANNVSTAVTFQYGLSSTYGSSVSSVPGTLTGSDNTSVSAALSGLQANTLYHYRVVAVNVNSTTTGDDMTFNTAGLPTAATNSASNINSTGATLNGIVNANSADATVTFEYGLSNSYGFVVAATPGTASGAGNTPVSATLSNLTPNTGYHYRVVAVNANGTIKGDDMSFTTNVSAPSVSLTGFSNIPGSVIITALVNAKSLQTTVKVQCAGQTVSTSPGTVSGSSNTSVSGEIDGLTAGSDYYLVITATNSAGSTSWDTSFTASPDKPFVYTNPANNVTSTGATLNGVSNGGGDNTLVIFEYGLDMSYGSTAKYSYTVTGNTAQEVAVDLAGLIFNTTYNFRIVGTNKEGTSYGDNSSFTTLCAQAGKAGSIVGPSTVERGGKGYKYGINAIDSATAYTWSLPTGATITNGANTNIITVSYSETAQSGNIKVFGSNSCNSGTVSPNFALTAIPALGINEKAAGNNITIYPNPAKDKLMISFSNAKEDYTLEILNIIGQTVISRKINTAGTTTEQVDLSGQPAGVYFVKVQTNNNTVVRKIIKE